MGEEVSTSGRQKVLLEATIPLDLAITRSRAAASSMAELSSRSGDAGKRSSKSLATHEAVRRCKR